tara:strand:- start:4798 stop:5265 length:468 start_codon:yes stop_codon:yes gene_type:complete
MNFYWPDKEYIVGNATELDTPDWRERWSNFSPYELADDQGYVIVLVAALDALQALRAEIGLPFNINSAYRNSEHNKRVGGGVRSMHLFGHAFDVSLRVKDGVFHSGAELEKLVRKHGFNGIGRYPTNLAEGKNGFIHIDMRSRAAAWGPANWRSK